MTDHQEKLNKIKARCQIDVAGCDAIEPILSDAHRRARAAAKATIAAIEAVEKLDGLRFGWDGDCGVHEIIASLIDSILTAWPDELL